MSLARTLAVARRIVAGFRRDHRSLALVVVVPIVITALLAWVIRGSIPGTTRVAIGNQAGVTGDRMIAILRAAAPPVGAAGGGTNGVEIELVGDGPAARDRVKAGSAQVAVILPADLAAAAAGGMVTLTVVTQGTDPAVDSQAVAALQQLVIRAAGSMGSLGVPPAGAGAVVGPGTAAPVLPTIRIAHETIFLSPDADTLNVMAPVFLGYFAYFFVFILTGISFLRERMGGTLERLLATPVSRLEIVLGYGLGFGLLATVQVVLMTAFTLGRVPVPAIGPIGEWGVGLGISSAGSPILAFVVVLLLAIGAVNLGIFLSTFARTELQIVQFIPIVIVPQGLLSGIFWPVERLPALLQAVAHVLPVTYAVDALRAIMLRGDGLGDPGLALDVAVLALVAALFVMLASLTIKRDIA